MQLAGLVDTSSPQRMTAFFPVSDIPFNHFEQRMNFRQTHSERLRIAGRIGLMEFLLEVAPFEQDLPKGDGKLIRNAASADLGTIEGIPAPFRLLRDCHKVG